MSADNVVHGVAKVSYTASGGLVGVGALDLNDVAIVVGMVLAVLTFLTNVIANWYWKRKHYELAVAKAGVPEDGERPE